MKRTILPLVLLLAFTAFSMWPLVTEGYLGFLRVAAREPWALQMLIDVAIACFLVSIWLVRDARARGLPSAPYLVAMFFLGSIGALAYLVHRGVAARKETADAPETPAVSVPS